MTEKSIADMRVHYLSELFDMVNCSENPFEQFNIWFNQARQAQLPEPNAMTLATATSSGIPSARIVLLKEFSEQGFVFFTNYNSHKGRELSENPNAALVFAWIELFRQVRIEGKVEKISPSESEKYFQSRPRGSQIGAWASPQSSVITSRSLIEEKQQQLEAEYYNEAVLPLPPFWGGYLLIPQRIEFWQGRENRLHDRILFTRADVGWQRYRLAP